MLKNMFLAAAIGSAALLSAGSAGAVTNLVQNGDFSSNGGNGQLGDNTSATHWTVAYNGSNSYDFLFNPQSGTTSGTSADNHGAVGEYNNSSHTLKLWGPGTGVNNGLTEPPGGGAIVGVDPYFQNTNNSISQLITGLTSGDTYTLTFYYAAAQQSGFGGATQDGWTVDWGNSQSKSTGLISDPNHGFSGWDLATFTFTADGTSDLLKFVADGTGKSELPPFALLADVSLTGPPTGVPEPATWALMLVGVGALGAGLRTRRRELMAVA